jgi:pyruvate/2-oxoglutarate dehydrogenase complex dihydrolipoamide dehydrogenase (E3) component
MSQKFDIIVIGGGPAGVTAALQARELGASVALVERGRMGGTCTNDGCAPTRVLAKAARLIRDTEQFELYGLRGAPPVVDFPALIARTQAIVGQLHDKKDLLGHPNRSGVVVMSQVGKVTFADPHHIQLDSGQRLGAEQFIICAGGHARRLDFPGAEHTLTHRDIWELDALPRRVAIMGGSATGCQLASILNAFGVAVSLLETASRPLPTEDELVAQTLVEAFERRGVTIVVNLAKVNRVERSEHGLELAYSDVDGEHRLTVDAVVQAVGWPGNTDSLNLEAAGVETERSYIKVDQTLRTSQPHIFAAGDITGRMMLVQGATDEARAAAQNAVLGRRRIHEHRVVAHGGFTDPEYGSVGMTEAQASDQHDVTIATVPYADLDRAVIDSRSEGWCKLIVSRETHAILGAHVVGEQAVEIIHLVAALMQAHSTIERLAQLEIAYPTFAAVVGLAARQITRELSALPIAMQWGVTNQLNAAEWERKATNTALPSLPEHDGAIDAGAS